MTSTSTDRTGGPKRLARHQSRVWSRRAGTWEHEGSQGLTQVVETILKECPVAPADEVADLGTGTGQLALPLARGAARVFAVDVSSKMLDLLQANAQSQGLANVASVESAIETVTFPSSSLDLVVSNYALHHLKDRDKKEVVARAATWLRPGGRIVIGDMMFGRGSDGRDRAIIRSKVAALARLGPGGWWRIAKNAWRFTFRVHEQPVKVDVWKAYLADAGFTDIVAIPVVAEAAVVMASRPAHS
ncbi:MAG: class I SAM-dependent methyltransferase [Actinomycetota bacterium]|nr:class I SAM-dependent methyltransferase [Actinomycetota bacterium]